MTIKPRKKRYNKLVSATISDEAFKTLSKSVENITTISDCIRQLIDRNNEFYLSQVLRENADKDIVSNHQGENHASKSDNN